MNNLEKEIYYSLGSTSEAEAKAAASVAMKWIEKAYNAGYWDDHSMPSEGFKELLKTKKLTPTEPDTKEPA